MCAVLYHFLSTNCDLNVLRRKGLNNNRVVQLVFHFFTLLSSIFNAF